jgi:hypothetical protein
MRQDFVMRFSISRFIAAAPQRRAKPAFQPREDTFRLPTVSVLAAVEATNHLSAVMLLGPFARAASIEGNDRRTDPQSLSGHAVIGFGVVSTVGQQAIDLQIPTRLEQCGREQGRIVGRPHPRDSRSDEMRSRVTDDREFGMLAVTVAPVSIAPATGVVCRTDRGRQTGRVDGSFGLLFDQTRLVSIVEDRTQQAFKAPFFASLRRAWKSVVGCGSFLSSRVCRKSDQSSRYATMPRSSVLRNCSKAKIASNWCWVKSLFEYLDEYAGIAWQATERAILAKATGERVATRRLMVSISNCTK